MRVNDVMQDALFLMKSDMFFKHRVNVRLQLGDELPKIQGRHSDLAVILLHLVQNSLDAMTDSDVKELDIETSREESHIVIRIRDTGSGISDEDGPRIFEPFFSTKHEIEYNGKVENRPGLGLSVASLLLEDFHGKVSFESIPHETTFVLEMPFLG
jgi:C4-dicarboxylate-specific signal transduction histidine kinase